MLVIGLVPIWEFSGEIRREIRVGRENSAVEHLGNSEHYATLFLLPHVRPNWMLSMYLIRIRHFADHECTQTAPALFSCVRVNCCGTAPHFRSRPFGCCWVAAKVAIDALRLTINHQSQRNGRSHMTVQILWEHYSRAELPFKDFSTQDAYSSYAKNWILPRLGDVLVPHVKTVDVER